jgi:hypothetical protein
MSHCRFDRRRHNDLEIDCSSVPSTTGIDDQRDDVYLVVESQSGGGNSVEAGVNMLEVKAAALEKLKEFIDKQKLEGSFRVYQSYG